MVILNLVTGDITQTPNDGLITLINSEGGGLWYGQIDQAIRRVAGNEFHRAVDARLRLLGRAPEQGEAICVDGETFRYSGSFRFVIFVIDDHKVPLSQLVHSSLLSAKENGLSSVSMPVMRTGNAMGQYERDLTEVTKQMMLGIKQFSQSQSDGEYELAVTVIVHGDPDGSTRKLLASQAQSILR